MVTPAGEKQTVVLSPTTVPSPTTVQTEPINKSTLWAKNANGSYTIGDVSVGTTYSAPFNNAVKIVFTKLPKLSATITVKEVSSSYSVLGKQVGLAYEITSSLPNQTFLYDLTLPIPKNVDGQKATVSYSEDGSTFQTVPNEKNVDTQGHTVTIKNLDHFTIFTLSLIPDTTPPTGVITSPKDGQYFKTKPLFTADASDDVAVASVTFQYKIAGTIPYVNLNTATSSPYVADWSGHTLVSNTDYDLRILVADTSGNVTKVGGVSFFFDKIKPTIAYNNPASGSATPWYSVDPGLVIDIDFLWGGGAPLDKAQYKIGLGNWVGIFTKDQAFDYTTNWGVDWNSLLDGQNQISLKVRDKAGNQQRDLYSASKTGFLFQKDSVPPTTPLATPGPGDYLGSQIVSLSSSDADSGVSAIYYTIDGSLPDKTKNLYTGPITITTDTTISAIAYDNAGNASSVFIGAYGIAPVITNEASVLVTQTTATITWATNIVGTSRVLYDTLSHTVLGGAPNYGYAFSTTETDTTPKVITHSVTITGLTPATTYYYRAVSHGSPEAEGNEQSFATLSPAIGGSQVTSSSSNTSNDSSNNVKSGKKCTHEKPKSKPILLSAEEGENEVTLTWKEGEGPITYYLITYGFAPGEMRFGNPKIGPKGTTKYTVQNLSAGVTYYFRVRSGNVCMPGEFSNELWATPHGSFHFSFVAPAFGFSENVLATKSAVANSGGKLTFENDDFSKTPPQGIFVSLKNLFFLLPFAYFFLFIILIVIKRRRKRQR